MAPASQGPVEQLEAVKIEKQTDQKIASELPSEHPTYQSATEENLTLLISQSVNPFLKRIVDDLGREIPNSAISSIKLQDGDIYISGSSEDRITINGSRIGIKRVRNELASKLKRHLRSALHQYYNQHNGTVGTEEAKNIDKTCKALAQRFSKLFLDYRVTLDTTLADSSL